MGKGGVEGVDNLRDKEMECLTSFVWSMKM